jgi:hypothetical protein
MAKVNVAGIVAGVHKERIISLWETFDVNGREVYRKWTIWADIPWNVAKDDWLEVTGDLGSKMGTYEKNGETKTVVEHSINSPQLITHKRTEELKGPLGGFLSNAEKTELLTNTDNAPF